MADRRERALLFDRPSGVTEIEIKRGIDEEEVGNLVAMQALPNGRLLIELDSALGAQKLLQHGFDAGDSHIMCRMCAVYAPRACQEAHTPVVGARRVRPNMRPARARLVCTLKIWCNKLMNGGKEGASWLSLCGRLLCKA